MLKVGIVGFGFMGRMHYNCWQKQSGAEVVAVCDSNPNLTEDTKKSVGNIEGADDKVDFSKLKIFSDFDKMLSENIVDAVSITLPTYLHANFSIKAMKAGVHVLCEKPMSLNQTECQRMIDAAKETRKILQIGHCVRFWPEYAVAKEIIDSGKYGKVKAVTLQRLSAPPTWSMNGWLDDDSKSGGMALDLHIHDSDYVQYLMGTPNAVRSFACKSTGGAVMYIATNYIYDDDVVITAEGSWAMMPSFGFEMSFNIIMEKAILTYDCTRKPAFRVCPADGEAFTPQVPTGDGYTRQIEHFVDTINAKDTAEVTTLAQSAESVRIVQAEVDSALNGKTISL